ncbi:cation-translocating P-type ATPase [Chitinimonas koreensis]|uniref:cation-translocating P-type ATPase n=1 Tax=Chitinimonas koreensis TaxID=356302 RepID=UPI0004263E59|nr:HAD-IC family P-type ATPase [Chitinimonas koreensis]QNM97894.1 HAD-IC family P-type ATPase [Chitinimonas koreensis]
MSDWHALPAEQVVDRLRVDPARGLAEPDAAARLKTYGRNALARRPGRGPLARFAAQIGQPPIVVLVAAGAVTAVFGEWVDAAAILGVVLVNALAGFVQEGKAEAALAALTRMVASEAVVLRDGRHRKLPAEQLVPGDLLLVASGDKVAADLRLLSSKSLSTVESMLTGEAAAVAKTAEAQPGGAPLAERQNMAYAGTLVVGGQGMGVVVATGDRTETGRIARLIGQDPSLSTPLTRKLARLVRYLLAAILVLAVVTFAIGVLRDESALEMFMVAVALAVAAIPEGLPAAMTITLAIGVARMARRQAIVRQLPAVETLGSTTVVCADKTGTLTENAMTVRAIWAGLAGFAVSGHGYGPHGGIAAAGGRPAGIGGALRETLLVGALCNDARLQHDGRHWSAAGDPTEAALLAAARKGGLDEVTLNAVFPRLDELPFDADRQYMATLHEIEGTRVVCVKGAPEKLLPACSRMLDADGHERPLLAELVQIEARRMGDEGLRVLALARSELAAGQRLDHDRVGRELVFLGLVGMIDPPRPRAITAVRTCQGAGIRVKMITGDHPATALAVSSQLGIVAPGGAVLTGGELAALDETALCRAAAEVDVFARVAPEQKLRLVQALQANGEVVAMTGDGVNDAPALRQADIGIAMGRDGTEVAKEAAAMVLTDDNFASIEAAVAAGRGIYDNLVKFLAWTIPTNVGEGLVVVAAVCAGSVLPITPLQILWINMTTAILLGLMLAFEPAERGIMQRPPRPPAAPVLDRALVPRLLLVSVLLLVGVFGLFEWALRQGQPPAVARTVASNALVLVELAYLFNCRSLGQPCWRLGWFANRWIWLGSAAMVALQLAFTYLPLFNRVFQTAPLELGHWAVIVAYALGCGLLVEAEKRRRPSRRKPCRPSAASPDARCGPIV